MAYVTSDTASVTTLTGTGAPTAANVFRFRLRYTKPRRNVTKPGDAVTKYRMTRSQGDFYFDVMVNDSDSTPPALPQNTVLSFVVTAVTGQTYTFDGKIESHEWGFDVWEVPTQYVRYTCALDSDVTLG